MSCIILETQVSLGKYSVYLKIIWLLMNCVTPIHIAAFAITHSAWFSISVPSLHFSCSLANPFSVSRSLTLSPSYERIRLPFRRANNAGGNAEMYRALSLLNDPSLPSVCPECLLLSCSLSQSNSELKLWNIYVFFNLFEEKIKYPWDEKGKNKFWSRNEHGECLSFNLKINLNNFILCNLLIAASRLEEREADQKAEFERLHERWAKIFGLWSVIVGLWSFIFGIGGSKGEFCYQLNLASLRLIVTW